MFIRNGCDINGGPKSYDFIVVLFVFLRYKIQCTKPCVNDFLVSS